MVLDVIVLRRPSQYDRKCLALATESRRVGTKCRRIVALLGGLKDFEVLSGVVVVGYFGGILLAKS
jgi:hypothetical protein